MILDFDISPADDARKEIAAVLGRIDKFLQDRENGLAHASKQDLQAYLKQMFNFSTEVLEMVVNKESYALSLELGYVRVDCKLKRY